LVLVGIHFGENTGGVGAAPITLTDSSPVNLSAVVEGDMLKIQLMPDGINELYGFQLDIGYDNQMLKAISVTEGQMLSFDGCHTYWYQPEIDRQTGNIQNIAATRLQVQSGTNGNGLLATISFRIKDANKLHQSTLLLKNVKLVDSKGTLLVALNQAHLLQLESIIIPQRNLLAQNYPNPFNPETWIPYQLAQDSEVTISIYNQKGQLVRFINLGAKPTGMYFTKGRAGYWDGKNDQGEKVASGLYFYQLKSGDFSAVRKMLIVK